MGSSEVCVRRGLGVGERARIRHGEFRGMCYEGVGVRERVRHGSSEVCVMRGWECERVRHGEFRGMCYEGVGVRERVRHGEFRGMC